MKKELLFERFDRHKEALKSALVEDMRRVKALKGEQPLGRERVPRNVLLAEYVAKRDDPAAWATELTMREQALGPRPKAAELAEAQVMLYAKEMEKELANQYPE